MKSNRVITVAIIVGVLIVAVTFLGAARISGDDTPSKDAPKILSPVKAGSKGVVVFGNFDVDSPAGLLALFPETLPQPSKVVKVYVTEGQTVAKDEKLASFDPELADLTVEEAKAGLAQAQGALKRAEALLKLANQTIEAHKFLIQTTSETVMSKALELDAAKIDLDEKKAKLSKYNAQNDPELRMAEKKAEAASKALDAEKTKLDGMKKITPINKKDEAEGAVAEAKAAIAKQESLLKKAQFGQKLMTLNAPVEGKIIRSQVAEGMTFGVQTKQPAFWLQPKGPIIVRAEVDQEWASRIQINQAALIQDDGNQNLKWTGRVIRLADVFLPKRSNFSDGLMLNDTRVLECIINIESVDPKNPVRIGQRVKVSIGVE